MLSTYNIKILVLIVSSLNGSECVVLRVIAFVLIDMSTMFVMSFSLFLVDLIGSDSTSIFVSSSLTSYCSETSFLSVPLSPESSLDSSSINKDSFEILDSSSLESSSSSPMVPSR